MTPRSRAALAYAATRLLGWTYPQVGDHKAALMPSVRCSGGKISRSWASDRNSTGRPVTAAVAAICSSSATDVSDSAIRTAPDSR